MPALSKELSNTIKVWSRVSPVLSTLHTEEQYEKAISWLDQLIDEDRRNSRPVLDSLIDTLGTLIKDYEDRNLPEPEGDPIGVLQYLMDEHQLKQSDLPELGSQGVVSEIISGKRQLNIRQIKALSKRFHVSPAVFI